MNKLYNGNLLANKKILVLLFVSLIIRLLVYGRFQPWSPAVIQDQILIFDSFGYHNLALCIKNYFSFCGDAFRTPGYPAFMALVYSVFGNHPYAVLFIQIFLNLASVALMYKIGQELFSDKAGFIAAVLFSLDPHHIIFINYLLTETLYTTVFLAGLFYLIRGLKTNQVRYFIVSGGIYGISTLVRPISQYYIAGILLFLLIRNYKNWKNGLRMAVLLLAAYCMVIAPWCYRNYHTFGHFAVSNIKGYNLLFWNASYYEAKRQHKTINQINDGFLVELKKMGWTPESNPFDKEKLDGELAAKIIKAHFADYLKTHLTGTVKIHLSLGTQSLTEVLHIPAKKWTEEEKYTNGVMVLAKKFFATKTIYEIVLGLFVALFLIVVYSFSVIGIWDMVKQKQVLLMLFLLGSAGYFALISGIISYARYRLPSMPFYILLASVGMVWWLERRKSINKGR